MNYAGNAQTIRGGHEPVSQHPIPSALDSLSMAINGLAAAADVLTNRLGSVTMPSPPTPADGAGPQRANLHDVNRVSSPLADGIEAQCQRIENITAGLQDVLNRLEV